ncbi:hypothetical protein EG68_01084 [Paragonimus skrjabini miyazakii]|uniref:ANK_REP_REGION domain-containing protein n=1 Tax=Paragonimus skrjabini miyazakii TaxID=59628 RepID=A0A8S9Z3W0_9TREM|nr:hypothetical protein EG68_01084 [Paragonimus skrjabini miyazakii]
MRLFLDIRFHLLCFLNFQQPSNLVSALAQGRVDLAEGLWEQTGQNRSVLCNQDCFELLSAAIQSDRLQSVCFLAERNVPLDCTNEFGETALHLAAKSGNVDIVEYLAISGGVSPSVTDHVS